MEGCLRMQHSRTCSLQAPSVGLHRRAPRHQPAVQPRPCQRTQPVHVVRSAIEEAMAELEEDQAEVMVEFDEGDFDFLDHIEDGQDDPAFAKLYDGSAAYRKLAEGRRNLSAAEQTPEKGGRGGRGGRDERGKPGRSDGFEEAVLSINRVCKVVKGGRHVAFRADVVVGNKAGLVRLQGQHSMPAAQLKARQALSSLRALFRWAWGVPLPRRSPLPSRSL